MAQLFCVPGNKGGAGKTTLSHMIARGMGLLGKRVAVGALTDLERDAANKSAELPKPALFVVRRVA